MKIVPTKGAAFLFFSAVFFLASLVNQAQTAVFTLNSDLPFTAILEGDTIAEHTRIAQISNVPVEILALTLQQNQSRFTTLLFGRLGDTSYYEVDFGAQRLIARVLPPKGDSITTFLYSAPAVQKDTGLQANSNILANASEKTLAPAKPRFNIDAAAILSKQNGQQDSVLALNMEPEPEDTLADVCSEILTEQELKSIRNILRKTMSINMQLRMVQSALNDKCLYVKQLYAMYRHIEEDGIKVSLFKTLFPQILDPEERYRLYDHFLFETSMKEIESYEP